MRKKLAVLVLASFTLVGCNSIGESAGMGALLGAGVASVTGGNVVDGAVIGAGAGAACYATNTC